MGKIKALLICVVSILILPWYFSSIFKWLAVRTPRFYEKVIARSILDTNMEKILELYPLHQTRKVGPINYQLKNQNNIDSQQTKIILVWTTFFFENNTTDYYFLQRGRVSFIRAGCPDTNCIVSMDPQDLDKADYVVFHYLDVDVNNMPPKHRPDQVWILHTMEPPVHLMETKIISQNGIYNWTMGYREDSDIVVKYGFVGKKESPDNGTDLDNVFHQKTKSVVWFVTRCKSDGRREDYVKELTKYIDVEIYGQCGNKLCLPKLSAACYEDIFKLYKFYFSFENSVCKDYVTEKFFNVLNYNIVPVVFGGANYKSIAPPYSFIDASQFPKPQDLATYLTRVGKSKASYGKYLEWKQDYQSYLYPWPCYLCDKMHEPVAPSILMDVKEFLVTDAMCKRWEKNKGFLLVKQY